MKKSLHADNSAAPVVTLVFDVCCPEYFAWTTKGSDAEKNKLMLFSKSVTGFLTFKPRVQNLVKKKTMAGNQVCIQETCYVSNLNKRLVAATFYLC